MTHVVVEHEKEDIFMLNGLLPELQSVTNGTRHHNLSQLLHSKDCMQRFSPPLCIENLMITMEHN